jgi:hypothetical protein
VAGSLLFDFTGDAEASSDPTALPHELQNLAVSESCVPQFSQYAMEKLLIRLVTTRLCSSRDYSPGLPTTLREILKSACPNLFFIGIVHLRPRHRTRVLKIDCESLEVFPPFSGMTGINIHLCGCIANCGARRRVPQGPFQDEFRR